MITQNLGYPRIGSQRELKKACEQYWAGRDSQKNLLSTARNIRKQNWQTHKDAGIDLIPCNDFSFYDQVLDTCLMTGAIPSRYSPVLAEEKNTNELDLYFAMARGYQKNNLDITAMEMTKWFDTNYHYIVPEFVKDQEFSFFSEKVVHDFYEAKEFLGFTPKPVIIGPVSFLLLGKEKEDGFHRLDLLDRLLPVYEQALEKLAAMGAEYVQFDEPILVMNLSDRERAAIKKVYENFRKKFPQLKTILTTYFECTGDNLKTAAELPVCVLHLDLVRCPSQLDDILKTGFANKNTILSVGVVDGRNIWKNDYEKSLTFIKKAVDALGKDRVIIAPSCSLLHVPYDLDLEKNEAVLSAEVKNWMAFAKQKLHEVSDLRKLADPEFSGDKEALLNKNKKAIESRKNSELVHNKIVKQRVEKLSAADAQRKSRFGQRQLVQQEQFNLPLMPTTTIGSFPQTTDIRKLRASYKKKEISLEDYEAQLKEETKKAIKWQEDVGLDVLVHGEFERNDMVEYFGELLNGYVFTENGWVQSYGSRCVKPPIIYGDVERKAPMTVKWATYAQSLTDKPVKGMLTGPVTMLQWSFVRDDQPRKDTALQLALAIRDEVVDLENAGINIIQIDEPAFREGLPLRRENWENYLNWAVNAFKVASCGVKDETQIHTHMCYSEFNDIITSIADMDADVITIETSRSQMELLEAFTSFKYPNEIGPGVYDIHSPRVPAVEEMTFLLEKALDVLPSKNLWVNPDCGLKTRKWPETEAALKNMVKAAGKLREEIKAPANI
ncbi:5-methyltetrahydropteroyltriglutamate--homocysteine S-methyltransferase [Cytophagaceae bacterium ABcell3]|nr:5-methyltetrahydropteroyltriglutamate--homocysteine S-methyltransferase [Cytophagaceae bacterium ABcell3]